MDTTDRTAAVDHLLQLGLSCMQSGQREQAVALLEQAIVRAPANALAHALLGAEYAQLGRPDDGCAHLEQALQCDPSLHVARFQLGLLHLTSGRGADARAVWGALDALGPEHFLYLFKEGLLAVAAERLDEGRRLLQRGMAWNHTNLPLNRDMAAIVAKLEAMPDWS
ncbi:tetratricopeptide repeat protein [Massilia endophytica]|uniref:tetratricopeptide repeat protein n=1 Tax=Massilia endophytica TaxID=2899220 RepID=UPI001E5F2447|nr:tetratricopeptide repeat protein [Massilia endophytica]UGQ47983.1 tetratricopeptide repeat protein [Massilia endophytica]